MKKNIVFGMLVSLLAIPMYTVAQEAAPEAPLAPNATLAADEAAVDNVDGTSAEAEAPKAKKQRADKYANVHYSGGSVISVGFGAGCSGMQVTGDNVKSTMDYPSYNASLRYTYYFFRFMGFTTGVDFTTYRAKMALQGDLNYAATTDMGIDYLRRLSFSNPQYPESKWSEIENISMIEVPIALSFKAKPNKVGFLGTLGLKMAFPVKATYQYQEGSLNLYNVYPTMGGEELVGPHTWSYTTEQSEVTKYNNKVLSTVNAGVFAEAGILFQVHPRVDMSLSIYGSYIFNDANGTATNDRQQLGFAFADNTMGTTDKNGFVMNQYKGLFGTDAVNRINPFNCGVKLALHINSREKSDEQIAAEAYIAPEVVYVYDTINKISVQVIHDTVVKEVRIPVDPVEEAPLKSYIYYRVGDSSHPVFEPEDMLDRLAEQLLSDPSASIILAGHSSPEGNPIYNEILAQKRADTIARMLMEKGVKKEQLIVRSYGSEQPSSVSGKDNLVKDRRVEVIPNSK